jgi:hypothetical protein
VTLTLPGFRGPADGALAVKAGQLGGAYFTASWAAASSLPPLSPPY